MFSINPKFRDRLTKLDKDQLTALREDIQAAGHVRDPLVVWTSPSGKEFLVDGHHRWAIIQELEIGFATRKLDFKTEDEVLLWIDRNQFARRNVSDGEMAILRGRIFNQRKAEHGGDRKSKPQGEVLKQTPQKAKSTAEAVAKEVGVSRAKVERDGIRAAVHDEAAKADPVIAKAVADLPQSDVDAIKKETASVEPEKKPEAVVEAVKARAPIPRPEPPVIEGACEELIAMVAAGHVSEKVAKSLVEQVPGITRQRELVAKGEAAVKAASRPSEPPTPKTPELSEAALLRGVMDASKEVKVKVLARTFKHADKETREAVLHDFWKNLSEVELSSVAAWARRQAISETEDISTSEMKGIVARAKYEGREKTRLSLLKALLDEPTAAIKASIKAWTHKNLVGKSAVFVPPADSEVVEFAKELRQKGGVYVKAVSYAESFYDFYCANGWVQGQQGKPLSDWKAAFRLWCKNQVEGKFGGPSHEQGAKPIRELAPHPSLVG